MSDESRSLVPSSSATFALTLDQNVSREVRKRVIDLEKKTKNAAVGALALGGGVAVGSAALWSVEPVLAIFGVYGAFFAVPLGLAVWWWRKKASTSAVLLNQDKDVAFVGPDGLVFFADDGFFIERGGGFKPYGVREPQPRRFDTVEYFAGNRVLSLSSSSGYALSVRVPNGWTERDTARVREKVEAFSY